MYTADELLDLKLQYDTQGFVHLKNLLPRAIVAHVSAAFDAAARRAGLNADAEPAQGKRYVDLPAILDADPVFIELADLPSLFPLLRAVVGEDIALNQTAARLFYPGPTFTSPFHSDVADVVGVDPSHAPTFLAKVHFYFEDLSPEQGCLAFIPGSQHFPQKHVNPHRATLAGSSAVVRVVPRAGDVVLFNTHVLHMAEANRTNRVRKSIIYTYGHFWMKAYPSASPADLAQFNTNPQRQQLFGVPLTGVAHFARRLDRLAPPTAAQRLTAGCVQVVHRLLPLHSLPPRA
ncbi:phytanoyl-CoA dioxygenase family protein [Massilia agri]|uniref:Phytanoyl-CoA dioxygenase family protein n=1 Tax=Massilia agri TaxID=1886785 RepID=A0ABT2ALL3_9BURK|nr:phytanoyl-CoA dioxygenase family protein [Massilia agri]MCS0597141.1 phytanoyl-CoA dioxygenase family protein [Massilia agri]